MSLSKDRNTERRDGQQFVDPVAAGVRIFAGAIVVLNANGLATPAVKATGLKTRGIAEEQVDNTAGADGAQSVATRRGLFRLANSSADPISRTDIGNLCYLVDDQTVAKTDDSNARSAAGTIRDLDDVGVWVQI